MKKYFFFVTFCLTFFIQSKAQNRYVNWFFGYGVGLTFTSSGPSLVSGGKTATLEGVATMSDPCGNLLFYSDGRTIYNKSHQVMTNGSGLFGHVQSAEAVMNVPMPLSDSLYYVFTVYSYANDTGFQYHIVDMSKQGGKGEVISKNNKVYGRTSEKLCAVRHQNKRDYWILTHDWRNHQFKVFLLTDKGLNTTPVTSTLGPSTSGSVENAIGHLRPSSDGKFVVSTFWYQGILELYNFNNSTGAMSLHTKLTNFAHTRCYSIEFSPNNKLLYVGEAKVSSDNDVYQYDLTASNIANSRYRFTTQNLRFGDFVLGPDGKFYIGKYQKNYLDVINYPDSVGAKASYSTNGFSLGSQVSQFGLNNVIHPISIANPEYNILPKVSCDLSSPVAFELESNSCYDSLEWDFGDTASKGNNYSAKPNNTHTYSRKGKYAIAMTVYYKGTPYKITKTIKVPSTPEVNFGKDTSICGKINIQLNGGDTAITYLWNDNSTNKTKNVTTAGKYWVKSTLDGCSAYDTITILNNTVNPKFTPNDTSICFNNNGLTFKNTSTFKDDTLKSLLWKFSDNTSYTDSVFKKSFSTADSFSVKLVINSKNGCKDSLTKKVIVNPNTAIGFTLNKTPQCFNGHDVVIGNNSTLSKGSISYHWNFDDGTTSTSKDISSKKYANDTIYNITLITTTDKGCKDTVTKNVMIFSSPKSGFSINQTTQCFTYNSFDYTNASTIRTGNIGSQTWNFGDSKTSTSKDITKKQYATADSFAVMLLNISDKGCRDSISKKVYVNPNTAIGFSINKTPQCFNGHDVVITNNSTVSKGSINYNWNLGDGNTATTKDISTKKYSIDSTYSIRLITTTDKNCKDTISKSVTIYPSPKSSYSINQTTQCFTYNSFDYTNASTIRTGSIGSQTWNFGDSKTSASKDITKKQYLTADSFSVMLLNISDKGCRDSISKKVYVNPNTAIGFSINQTPQCFNGHDVVITNNSTVSKGSINYNWNLGDGSTATTKDISTKKYSIDSTYIIRLITTTDKNCKDTISKNVTIHPSPKTSYSINQITQCFTYNSFDYTNAGTIRTGNIASQTWNFGDSKTSSSKDITKKQYTTADSFAVMLLNISDKGCRDSLTKKVYVNPNTSIGFSINKTPQCFNGHDVIIANNSTVSKGTMSYDWNLGDGNSATTKDISSKKYSKDSTYSITLITTTDKNCKDTIAKSVTIHPSPKAGFSINQVSQCFKWNLYSYTNSSTIRVGSIAANNWNLGDADTRTTKDITSKHYNTEDSFKVALLTISNNGCRDSITQTVYILNTPKPSFTVSKDTQCFNGHGFEFTNTSSIAKGSFTNLWEQGDATNSTNTDVTQKTYSVYGNYKVLLITTSNNNCKDSIEKSIRIHASPITKFTIDKDRQCFRNNNFNFTNQSSIPEGTITYNWSLGESKTATTQNITNHKYTTEDTFDIRLITTSNHNCQDTLNKMAVTFAQPQAKIVVPEDSQCWQKHFFILHNNTTIKYGTLTHLWDFGDGTKDVSHTPSTKRYANKSASYMLKYKVTSDHGCTDSAFNGIALLERPISEFAINDSIQCYNTNSYSFTNKTTFSDLSTITYFWNYGEGTKTTGKTPKTIKYPTADYYTVSLIAESYLNNCIDTIEKVIVVAPHASPDYIVDKDSQCLRTNLFKITNQTNVKFGTLKYNWNFGDGTKDTATNPTKKYTSGSNYPVKLIATTNYNCKDSTTKPITLIPHPKSGFTVADSTLCSVQSLSITNTTTVQYGTFNQVWHYDEGSDETTINVSGKKLIKPGFHPIRLAIISNFGCTDTITKNVFVEQPRTTKINIVENDSQCLRGNKTQFNVISQGGIITLSSYIWQFGDGNTATTQNPTHTYSKDSTFIISAETVSSNGCLDTAFTTMVIHPHPQTDFDATSPCFPNPVEFTNTSKIKLGTITSQLWDLSVNTSTQLQPKVAYAQAGTYSVKLKNRSNYGCLDSLTKSVTVKVRPMAKFSYKQIPSPDEIHLQLTNESSSDVITSNWDFGNGQMSSEVNPLAIYKDSGRFYVILEVLNNEGCADTFSLKTGLFYPDFVFYVPTTFSPNGNGINDVFKPLGSQYNREYSMEIFNRWGEKIFETHDVTQGWDGSYMGKDCQEGVYQCHIRIMPMKGPLKAYYTNLYLLR